MIGIEPDSIDQSHVVLVHEMGRRWVEALRGSALGCNCYVRHSASVPDTLASVRTDREVTLIVELGRQPLEALELVEMVSSLAKDLPVLVLARSDQADLEVPARELGATAFLREPLTGVELAGTIRAVMELQRKRAGLG